MMTGTVRVALAMSTIMPDYWNHNAKSESVVVIPETKD
jgi:hypothetical protein